MVLLVRQDLKMKPGKIASQCAHAATGMYAELAHRETITVFCHRSLLRQWEQCGQPKIVVTCKNQQEMNRLKEDAETIGLPTFIVADAGRTQVSAGSKTVLAIGPALLWRALSSHSNGVSLQISLKANTFLLQIHHVKILPKLQTHAFSLRRPLFPHALKVGSSTGLCSISTSASHSGFFGSANILPRRRFEDFKVIVSRVGSQHAAIRDCS